MQKYIDKHLKNKSIISLLLYPFSLIFMIIVMIRRKVYKKFDFLSYQSKIKIISVGNITSGGTGKTPFTIHLSNDLISKGKKIAIVLRGYKSNLENTNTLIVQNETFTIVHGDEASIYAEHFPDIPICVGKDRVKSIKLLEEKFPNLDFILMDDAFQHLQVKQDIKYCLFNASNPLGNGFCLPAGILREPIISLKEADFIVINGKSIDVPKKILKYNKNNIIFTRYIINKIMDNHGNIFDIDFFKEKKNVLLSGIGNPKSFEQTVTDAGIEFTHHIALSDHFEYSQSFIDESFNKYSNFDNILTTEKDYMKLRKLNIWLRICVVYVAAISDRHIVPAISDRHIRTDGVSPS